MKMSFCAAAASSMLVLFSCSARDSSSPNAIVTPDLHPSCGNPAKAGARSASCLPKLPPLTDAQKKRVLAVLSAENLNDDVVSSYVFGGPVNEDPGEADLVGLLSDARCLKDSATDADGRSLGRIYGDVCPITSSSSFLNSSTPAGSKEELSLEITVKADDYAARSQLSHYRRSESGSGTTTETAPKRYHTEGTGSLNGSFEDKAGTMTFAGGTIATSDVDASQEGNPQLLALDLSVYTRMSFKGFDALLHLGLKAKDDGHGHLVGTGETTLNGEPVGLPQGLLETLQRKASRAAMRKALSGI